MELLMIKKWGTFKKLKKAEQIHIEYSSSILEIC